MFFNSEKCSGRRAVEKDARCKSPQNGLSHRARKSRQTRGITSFPTAPTAAHISQTRSGIL